MRARPAPACWSAGVLEIGVHPSTCVVQFVCIRDEDHRLAIVRQRVTEPEGGPLRERELPARFSGPLQETHEIRVAPFERSYVT